TLRMSRLLCLSPVKMTCLRPCPFLSSVAHARGPAHRGGPTRRLTVCWMSAATGSYRNSKREKKGSAPAAAQRSRAAGPGKENCLDKFLGRVGGGRRVLGGGKCGLLELNGLLIAVEVRDAPGALGQVLVKLRPLLGGQVAEQVFVQELGEFAAVHTLPRRKCGSSRERRAWRPRLQRAGPGASACWPVLCRIRTHPLGFRTASRPRD